MAVPEEEDQKKGSEKILEEILVKNFPNMGKEIVTQVQEVQRVPYRIHQRRRILIHLLIKQIKPQLRRNLNDSCSPVLPRRRLRSALQLYHHPPRLSCFPPSLPGAGPRSSPQETSCAQVSPSASSAPRQPDSSATRWPGNGG